MYRGQIRYADIPGPAGRRPVVVVTTDELIPFLSAITCAPLTTRLRGLPTRVPVGPDEGLRESSEVMCEGLVTIEKGNIDTVAIGSISETRFVEVDRAISRSLDIRRANLLDA